MQRRQRRADKRPDTDTCGQGSPAGGSKPVNRSLIDHSPAQATLAAPGRGKPAAIPSFRWPFTSSCPSSKKRKSDCAKQ